jgi:cytochrome b involved in lipid metabolism
MCIPTKTNPAEQEIEISDSNSPAKKQIQVSELKAHNVPASAWTVVDNRVLDITQFSKRHPGGDIILLSAGKDATVLFRTYHPRGVPKSLLDKLEVGTLDAGNKVVESYYDWSSDFYPTLCKRVTERLESLNRPLRGNTDIQVKAILILAAFW